MARQWAAFQFFSPNFSQPQLQPVPAGPVVSVPVTRCSVAVCVCLVLTDYDTGPSLLPRQPVSAAAACTFTSPAHCAPTNLRLRPR